MPNGTYGGVRGEETKVGQKTFVSRPTRFSTEERENSSEVSFHSSEVSFHPSVENFRLLPGAFRFLREKSELAGLVLRFRGRSVAGLLFLLGEISTFAPNVQLLVATTTY